MKTYTISKRKYYLANELMKQMPSIFRGYKTTRTFVDNNNLSKDKYITARLKDDEWISSDGSSKKFDKVFLRKKWIDEEYQSVSEQIEDAPDIIDLEDSEKFFDNDGNIIEIEVRGERNFDECYFKVQDISDGFGIKRLRDRIAEKYSYYEDIIHYKYFYLTNDDNTKKTREKKVKKLFLTYRGLLRVLFTSNKTNGDKFVEWATKTLFTAHMGTKSQKIELVGNLLGVSSKAVREVFNKTASTIPTIYLFSIGKVEKIKKSLNIEGDYDPEDYVYKWGMSKDLKRRTYEHQKYFSKIKNAELELVLFELIDPQYISEAETKLKHFFTDRGIVIEHEKLEEVAVISKSTMKVVKEYFDMISRAYAGHTKDLLRKIKDKDNEIMLKEEKHQNELLKEKHQVELLKKDLEIAQLQLNIMKSKQ